MLCPLRKRTTMNWKSDRAIWKDSRFILGLYVLIGLIAGIQRYALGPGHHNNFLIFQHSVFHFFAHLNPYPPYPAEYNDVFLYNPTFIILFVPFAYLPTFLGIVLWAVCTTVVYFLGVNTLPLSQKSRVFLFYLIIPELLTSLANIQTNPLIAAFTVLAFTLLEKGEPSRAAAFPPLNFFIKGYGAVAGVFFLLKNPKLKTFLYMAAWFVVLGALPLLFYSWEEFVLLYQQWFVSLRDDYEINTGLSVMGVVRSLIYAEASIPLMQSVGVLAFLTTFGMIIHRKNYDAVKYSFLAYVMIWMIIFNQAAESPTYIIASTGVFVWYLTSGKTRLDMGLFVFFMLLTTLSTSDVFPKYLADTYVRPYKLKALPCVLIWIKIQWELYTTNRQPLFLIHEKENRTNDPIAHI